MSLPAKILSALRLLARRDFATFGRQWTRQRRQNRLFRQKDTAFVHRLMGFPVVCHPDWPDSAAQFLDGHSDQWEFALLRAWLQPGDKFLDLGTNTGLYAYAALPAVGATGLVVAVDAASYVTRHNQAGANLIQAANFHCVQAAVTEFSGEITFHVRPDGRLTTEQSLRPDADQLAGSVPDRVPARTLMDLAQEHSLDHRLAAVKMDIEGAEAGALQAAPPGWFTADGPLWIVEINPAALARFGGDGRQIMTRFSTADFECWLLPKHPHDPAALPTLRPADLNDPLADSPYYNFFALPRGMHGRQRAARLAPFFPSSFPSPAA